MFRRSLLFLLLIPSLAFGAWNLYDPAEATVAPSTAGTTYYVKTTGSDSLNGLSLDNAWLTFSKAFGTDRNSGGTGARVLIVGGTYRQGISPTTWTAATPQNPIIVAPYDNTPVIIDRGMTINGSWSAYNANVYSVNVPLVYESSGWRQPEAVILNVGSDAGNDNNFLNFRPRNALDNLSTFGEWWFNTADNTLYVHTGGVNPTGSDYVIMPFNGYGNCISIPSTNSGWYIYGLTVQGCSGYGVLLNGGADHRVEKVRARYSGKSGIIADGATDRAVIYRNKVVGNALQNYPAGRRGWCTSNGGWPTGMALKGDNGNAEGNIVEYNFGEGINSWGGSPDNTTVQYNLIRNNFSINLYADCAQNARYLNNFIYSDNSLYGKYQVEAISPLSSGCTVSQYTTINKSLRAAGINFSEESGSCSAARSTGNIAANNIIIGTKTGFGTYFQQTGSGLKNAVIANNTIIMPNFDPATITSGHVFYGLQVTCQGTAGANNNDNVIFKNNIVYGLKNVGNYFLTSWLGSTCNSDGGATPTVFNNNLYYHPNRSNVWAFKGAAYTFPQWQGGAILQDASGINADPSMAGASFDYP